MAAIRVALCCRVFDQLVLLIFDAGIERFRFGDLLFPWSSWQGEGVEASYSATSRGQNCHSKSTQRTSRSWPSPTHAALEPCRLNCGRNGVGILRHVDGVYCFSAESEGGTISTFVTMDDARTRFSRAMISISKAAKRKFPAEEFNSDNTKINLITQTKLSDDA